MIKRRCVRFISVTSSVVACIRDYKRAYIEACETSCLLVNVVAERFRVRNFAALTKQYGVLQPAGKSGD
jgi:hypothetical protein